jgi:hypothetical protein
MPKEPTKNTMYKVDTQFNVILSKSHPKELAVGMATTSWLWDTGANSPRNRPKKSTQNRFRFVFYKNSCTFHFYLTA